MTTENTAYTFAEVDFNFEDVDGDSLNKVRITELETEGSLTLDDVDVILDQEIDASDIAAGKLAFTPSTDEIGDPYDDFKFKVHDGTGYSVSAYTMTIDVLKLHYIGITSDWNLISLSCYENIDKTNIIVRNNSIDYNWNDAINEGIILEYLYEWNRTGQRYNFPSEAVGTLEPGMGYWMFAYYDCELLIYSNPVGSGDITDLKQEWNLVGLPYEDPVSKENLIIHNESGDYTWQMAIDGGIILGFIYGWDTQTQFYFYAPSDSLDPGYGYWMYAYEDCTLKKQM
jgi:hypothetical protein